jgi:hypothetical protein
MTRAGRDASRSFVTGCFQTHLTHDLRGLTDDQLKVRKSSCHLHQSKPYTNLRASSRGGNSSKITRITD